MRAPQPVTAPKPPVVPRSKNGGGSKTKNMSFRQFRKQQQKSARKRNGKGGRRKKKSKKSVRGRLRMFNPPTQRGGLDHSASCTVSALCLSRSSGRNS